MTTTVRIHIPGKDILIGAMVKGLATQINGLGGQNPTLKGATTDFLKEHGFYDLNFGSDELADEFKIALEKYLSDFVEIR